MSAILEKHDLLLAAPRAWSLHPYLMRTLRRRKDKMELGELRVLKVLEQRDSSGEIGPPSHFVAYEGEVSIQRIPNVAAILPEALRYPESCSLQQTGWSDISDTYPTKLT